MKKVLMVAALLVVGATSFADITAPVNVSLDIVETSQLVLMDGNTQLTQIDLKHPQLLLTSVKGIASPSVVKQNFKVQSGDGKAMMVESKLVETLTYSLEGTSAGKLELTNGTNKLASTLALVRDSETIAGNNGAPDGLQNTITSTILPKDLNAIAHAGTYAGAATLKVVIETKTTQQGGN